MHFGAYVEIFGQHGCPNTLKFQFKNKHYKRTHEPYGGTPGVGIDSISNHHSLLILSECLCCNLQTIVFVIAHVIPSITRG